jgi:ABC-type nickel/cobalt efflux system permease component RcnA
MSTPNVPSENFVSYRAPHSGYTTSVEAYQGQVAESQNVRISSQEVAVASVGMLLLFAVWYFVRQNLRRRKATTEGLQNHPRRTTQADRLVSSLPCTRCHYFKANMYLPCAVNPTVALRPEAEDCGDFRPRSGHESTTAVG